MLKRAILLLTQIKWISARLYRSIVEDPMRNNFTGLIFAANIKETRMTSARSFCMKTFLILLAAFGAYPSMAQSWNEIVEWYNSGDYPAALGGFKKFANQNNPAAQFRLGYMYRVGQGVPQDYAEAAKWYRLAAEQCNPYGQKNLGLSYKNGEGVDRDLVQAHIWFNLAASLSTAEDHPVRKDAERFREEIASGLSRDELNRAQHLARELYESRCQ